VKSILSNIGKFFLGLFVIIGFLISIPFLYFWAIGLIVCAIGNFTLPIIKSRIPNLKEKNIKKGEKNERPDLEC
jgi:hypothetical protein